MKKLEDVTIVDIQTHLDERNKTVKTKAIKLQNFEVLAHDRFKTGDLELYVQIEPLDLLPIKQLCSSIGMSSAFYMDNPSSLNVTIFNERLRGLEESEGDRILRYRQTDRGNRLLAILPMAHQAPNYIDVVNPLIEALPSNHVVRLANYSEVDDAHRLSLRVSLLDFPVNVDERGGRSDPAELGLFIDMSEDGSGARMALTNMVYNQTCSNGAMVTYDRHPYFEYNYRGIKSVDLAQAVKSAISRFADDLSFIHQRMNENEKKLLTKGEALSFLRSLESRRDISLGFIRKVRKELDGRPFEHISRFRVVQEITQAAQKLHYDGRVRHEFVAGNILGLDIRQAA